MRSEAPPWLAPPWRRELALLLQGGVIAGGQLAPALLPEWPGNKQGLVKQWEENTMKLQVERAEARWRGRRLPPLATSLTLALALARSLTLARTLDPDFGAERNPNPNLKPYPQSYPQPYPQPYARRSCERRSAVCSTAPYPCSTAGWVRGPTARAVWRPSLACSRRLPRTR